MKLSPAQISAIVDSLHTDQPVENIMGTLSANGMNDAQSRYFVETQSDRKTIASESENLKKLGYPEQLYREGSLWLDWALPALSNNDIPTGEKAAHIEKIGDVAEGNKKVPAVLKKVYENDSNVEVRSAAIVALGKSATTEAETCLIAILANKKDPAFQEQAAIALKNYETATATEALLEALNKDSKPAVILAASNSLVATSAADQAAKSELLKAALEKARPNFNAYHPMEFCRVGVLVGNLADFDFLIQSVAPLTERGTRASVLLQELEQKNPSAMKELKGRYEKEYRLSKKADKTVKEEKGVQILKVLALSPDQPMTDFALGELIGFLENPPDLSDDPDHEKRNLVDNTIQALRDLGIVALPALAKSMQGAKSQEVRNRLINVLGITDPGLQAAVVWILDPNSGPGHSKDFGPDLDRLATALVAADKSSELARSLGNLLVYFLANAKAGDPLIAKAKDALIASGPVAEGIIKDLKQRPGSLASQKACIPVLVGLAKEAKQKDGKSTASQILVDNLANPNLRDDSAQALSSLGDVAYADLSQGMENSNPVVRANVLPLLLPLRLEFSGSVAVTELADLVFTDEDPDVQKLALESLAKIPDHQKEVLDNLKYIRFYHPIPERKGRANVLIEALKNSVKAEAVQADVDEAHVENDIPVAAESASVSPSGSQDINMDPFHEDSNTDASGVVGKPVVAASSLDLKPTPPPADGPKLLPTKAESDLINKNGKGNSPLPILSGVAAGLGAALFVAAGVEDLAANQAADDKKPGKVNTDLDWRDGFKIAGGASVALAGAGITVYFATKNRSEK